MEENAAELIRCREYGSGEPLVVLHGGWGYEIYPFDRQIAALESAHRIVIPDRMGYGRSPRPSSNRDAFELDFHERAAGDTRALLDRLGLERPVLWGHSDGAVIALLLALATPERAAALVLEAVHLGAHKPRSRGFFEAIVRDPASVGERVAAVLARDHGDDWKQIISCHSRAWLRLADEQPPDADFYGGRLRGLAVPTLVIHGARDPRTEPGELDALRAMLPHARFAVLPEGGHSPHSERATADRTTSIVASFLAECGIPGPSAAHAAS